MFVQTQTTPNPNSLKFLPGKIVSNAGSYEITKKENINNNLIRNILSINGVNGVFFTMTIIDTLNINLGCLPSCIITSGTAQISHYGYTDRIVNYNDSLCNCNVNVIIDGTTYPIVIEN